MPIELFKAIEDHDFNRVAELLSNGADPNSIQSEWPGWRPLHAAIEELEYGGPIEILTLLLKHGTAIDGWDAQHDSTPLLMAVFRGQGAAVRLLLDSGANPNVRGSEGDSPLRWCVEQQDRDMTALLLRFGAGKTINEFGGPRGLTALGIAADQCNIPMIELLLDGGADPDALDEDYKSARERLPLREECDPQAWDRAMDLLSRKRT
jgi:ankyrin repeat protein